MEKCTRRTSVCLECLLVWMSLWPKFNIGMKKDIQLAHCLSRFSFDSPLLEWCRIRELARENVRLRRFEPHPLDRPLLGSRKQDPQCRAPLRSFKPQSSFLVLSFRGVNFRLCKWQTLQPPARDARGKKKDDIDFRDYRTISETLASSQVFLIVVYAHAHVQSLVTSRAFVHEPPTLFHSPSV